MHSSQQGGFFRDLTIFPGFDHLQPCREAYLTAARSSMDTMMDRFKPDEMQAMMSMMEDYIKEAGDNPDPDKAPPHIKVA